MIETRLLLQFVAVAEELHFHRAALRLHMAQPPLSQAIKRLEEQLDVRLFERDNRSVTLTDAGTAFLLTARRTLLTLQDGVAHTRRVSEGIEGHLRLTFINIAPYPTVLRALRQFKTQSPAVTYSLAEASTHEQVRALENDDADIGFLRIPGASTSQLKFETLLREPMCVVLPATHPLTTRTRVSLKSLRDEDFVATPRALGQGFHDQIGLLCQAAGFEPRVVQHARQLNTLIGLVSAGFGIALLPASASHHAHDDVVFRPFTVAAPDSLRQVHLQMAWNDNRPSPVRDRLISMIRSAMRKPR